MSAAFNTPGHTPDRPDAEEAVALAARELREDLAASATDRHCFLLIDPSLRPVETQSDHWERYADLAHRSVHLPHANLAPEFYPVLTAIKLGAKVDPADAADAALLTHTVHESAAELKPEILQRGLGRRISGWLTSRAAIDEVAQHLGPLMVQRHPGGHDVWLRLQDPAVLWMIWGWLQPAQRATLLGPIERFYILNPVGQLQRLTASEPVTRDTLDLSEAQWAAIDCIEPLNIAFREWDELRRPDQLRAARGAALAAIQRARKLGFQDTRDLAFYGLCALEVHPRFDFHALIVTRLRARQPTDYFGGLVADLGRQEWQRIAREAPSLDATPSR